MLKINIWYNYNIFNMSHSNHKAYNRHMKIKRKESRFPLWKIIDSQSKTEKEKKRKKETTEQPENNEQDSIRREFPFWCSGNEPN